MKITLLPTTKRLKQLIKEKGNKWGLLRIGQPSCFNDTGLFIYKKDYKRWVKPEDVKEMLSDIKEHLKNFEEVIQ